MATSLSIKPTEHNISGRKHSEGCWTGWIADMEVIKNVMRKGMPSNYMESYPRHRATNLNTWLSRFGLYSNGMFFELDRSGSAIVKDMVKSSETTRGYYVRIDGKRDGHKIKVSTVTELPKAQLPVDETENSRISQSQLRGKYAQMNI